MRFLFKSIVLTLALLPGVALTHSASAAESFDLAEATKHSLVAMGDTARLQHALAKARRGEKVTVAVIGGSITQGAKATKPDNRYGNVIAAWWKQTFPKATIAFVNAGIGATGSDYGALRAQRDLLSHQPDFIVAEYAVNDGNTQAAAETLEGLVRQSLGQPNQPAVMLLFMMHEGGGNAQEWHSKVGAHYHLPMVSFRDGLWPEIKADKIKWADVEADTVHPNDVGHGYAGKFVISLLTQVLATLPADNALPAVQPIASPLFHDSFEHTALLEASDLKPVKNNGWELDPKTASWHSEKPGSVVEFEVTGKIIFLMDFHIRKPMGKAKIQVDDAPPIIRDGWFDQTWGGYRATTIIAHDLKPGPHHVRVELLAEKNPQSEGHEFRIMGLGTAGVTTR